jgi:excisionase family DNA binding protein
MNRDIITVKELADYLKVNPVTVYRMVRKGGIPAFRLGSEWRFNRDSIKSWISGQEEQNGNGKH